MVNDRKLIFDGFDDKFLFLSGRQRQSNLTHDAKVQIRLNSSTRASTGLIVVFGEKYLEVDL
jgi:hypothetical protein